MLYEISRVADRFTLSVLCLLQTVCLKAKNDAGHSALILYFMFGSLNIKPVNSGKMSRELFRNSATLLIDVHCA